MRDECPAASPDPALRALGSSAAALLPADDGPGVLLHEAGARDGAGRALARLTRDAALARLRPDDFDAEGLCADAGAVLPGLAPLCAARWTGRGGLVVLLAWDAGVPHVVLRAAFDALDRVVLRREGALAPRPSPFEPSPFEDVFENAALAMAVVGADRRIRAVNRAGRRLMAEARLLAEVGGRLRAPDPADDRRLREALDEGAGRDAPSEVRLAGADGAPGLRCEIGRIDRPRASEGDGGARFLLTAVPTPASAPVEALLARRYGLTRAEARLAAQLVAGHDLRAAGERVGVSHHTARKYLQITFSKMGVRRQADLVRRALQLAHDPAAVDPA